VPPALRAAIAEADTPAEKLQCVLDTLASLPASNPHFVPIMLREIASAGATLPDEMLVRMAGNLPRRGGCAGRGGEEEGLPRH